MIETAGGLELDGVARRIYVLRHARRARRQRRVRRVAGRKVLDLVGVGGKAAVVLDHARRGA